MTTNATTAGRSLLARATLTLAMMGGAMLALPAYAWDEDREQRWDRHRDRDYRVHHDVRVHHGWHHSEPRHRVYVTPGHRYYPEHHLHRYHYRNEYHHYRDEHHHYRDENHHYHRDEHHDHGRDALAIIGGAVLLHEILHH